MTSSEWKVAMPDFIDGVERELRLPAPRKTKVILEAFRTRLAKAGTIKSRKRFERELESFLQSDSALRAAATRYLRKKIPPIVAAAVETLKRAEPFLANRAKKDFWN